MKYIFISLGVGSWYELLETSVVICVSAQAVKNFVNWIEEKVVRQNNSISYSCFLRLKPFSFSTVKRKSDNMKYFLCCCKQGQI